MKYVYVSIKAENWSDAITTEWKPPEGLFTESPDKIATVLHRNSSDLKQAMSRLNFYINRAGSNLNKQDASRLEKAKEKLRNLYD